MMIETKQEREKQKFEEWLDLFDQHLKQFNRSGVFNQWTGDWHYTYTETSHLFEAFRAGTRATVTA